MRDSAVFRDALEKAVGASGIPTFFSFDGPVAPDQMVGQLVRGKTFSLFELKVRPEDVSSALLELPLLKAVFEHFRKVANRLLPGDGYPNVSFVSANVNGRKIPACVLLFCGKTSEGPAKPGYRSISAPCLTVEIPKSAGVENNGKEYASEAERIFDGMAELLRRNDFSVRKVFALGMRQWQSRLLYSKAEALGLFELDPNDPNRKTYFPENFGRLTLEEVRAVMESERP